MIERSGLGKILFAVLLFTVVVSPVAAEWNLDTQNSVVTDGQAVYTSPGSNTILLVEVSTDRFDRPVNESGTTDSSEFLYRYNASEGEVSNLEYYQDGLWYARFDTDLSKHSLSEDRTSVRFDVKGDRDPTDGVNSGGWQNTSLTLKAGKHKLDIVEGLPSTLIPGEDVNMTINVTNRSSGEPVNDSGVKAFFKNASWSSSENFNFDYNDSTQLYEGTVTLPPGHDSKYLMRVYAKNRSNSIENYQGSVSNFVETSPKLEGKLENLTNISGCESELGRAQSLFEEGVDTDEAAVATCEPESTLDIRFNNTGATLDNVTLEAFRVNRSTGDRETFFSDNMTPQQGLYSSELDVPDINTSAYESRVLVNLTLSIGDRSEVIDYRIGYNVLEMVHTGTRSAGQGQDYDLTFQAVKPVSLSPYESSEIHDFEVNITDPSGDQFASYNSSNFTFDDQAMAFHREVQIPQTAETGGWDLDMFGSRYLDTFTGSSGFSVSSSETTFEVNDTTFDKEESGVEDFNLTVRNLRDTDLTLETNLSNDLVNEIELNDSYSISASSFREIPITVNLTEYRDVSGHLNLTDTGTDYVRTVDLEVDTENCEIRAAHICSQHSKWINVTAENRGQQEVEIDFMNTKEDNSTNLTTSLEGNISDLIGLEDRYSIEDELTVQVNYTVETSGNYTGTITFQTDNGSEIVFNTSLETEFDPVEETGFSTSPEQVDLGVFPTGNERSADINVQNTGDVEVQNIEATSSEYLVNMNVSDLNVTADSVETVSLVFEGVETSEGQVTLAGNTSEGEVSLTLDVNATPVDNYASMTSQLTDRKQELEPVSKSNLTQTLTEVSGTITEIQTAWEEDNYLEAKRLYNDAQNKLDYVENNKGSTEGGDTGGNNGGTDQGDDGQETGGDQSDDPGNQGGDQGGADTGGPSTTQNEGGGGLPIIPIVVVILVLVIIGFVVYESYIPEEGDPLYGVLGEE